MSEQKNDGGQAFPTMGFRHGMTLRDYFAGQALAGITASAFREDYQNDINADETRARYVAWSFALAEAMLHRREND